MNVYCCDAMASRIWLNMFNVGHHHKRFIENDEILMNEQNFSLYCKMLNQTASSHSDTEHSIAAVCVFRYIINISISVPMLFFLLASLSRSLSHSLSVCWYEGRIPCKWCIYKGTKWKKNIKRIINFIRTHFECCRQSVSILMLKVDINCI